MCKHVHVYVCVCICVHVYVNVYVCMHIYVSVYVHLCILLCDMYVYVCMYLYMYAYVNLYVCMFVMGMYVYISVCYYVSIYMCVCAYMYMHMHVCMSVWFICILYMHIYCILEKCFWKIISSKEGLFPNMAKNLWVIPTSFRFQSCSWCFFYQVCGQKTWLSAFHTIFSFSFLHLSVCQEIGVLNPCQQLLILISNIIR